MLLAYCGKIKANNKSLLSSAYLQDIVFYRKNTCLVEIINKWDNLKFCKAYLVFKLCFCGSTANRCFITAVNCSQQQACHTIKLICGTILLLMFEMKLSHYDIIPELSLILGVWFLCQNNIQPRT